MPSMTDFQSVKASQQKAMDMSEKLAISILNSPINYEAKKRRSIQGGGGSSPANNTFQSMHKSNGNASSTAIYNTMMIETGNFHRQQSIERTQVQVGLSLNETSIRPNEKNQMITSVATSGFGYPPSGQGMGYFTSVNSPVSNSISDKSNFAQSKNH